MLENVRRLPAPNLAKPQTFDAPSWELRPSDIASTVDFVFIDGEHTNTAREGASTPCAGWSAAAPSSPSTIATSCSMPS